MADPAYTRCYNSRDALATEAIGLLGDLGLDADAMRAALDAARKTQVTDLTGLATFLDGATAAIRAARAAQ